MMVYLEGGSYHIFINIHNYFNFLYFGTENIFHIINRNIKNPNILQATMWHPWDNILKIWTQFFTYSVSVSASAMKYFSSYNDV